MKHALLIGDLAEGGLTRSLAHGFEDNGWGVSVASLGPWEPSPLLSAAFRYSVLARSFRRQIRETMETVDGGIDTVIVVKGIFVNETLIRRIRIRFKAPIISWNPDDPFNAAISNRGAGIPDAIPHYDGYVTFAARIADRVGELNPNVAVIPFGWDPHIHYPEPGNGSARDRVVFIGTWTEERERWIRRLSAWQPLVFGNGWPHTRDFANGPVLTGAEFRRVVGEARWNLNFLRPQNRQSHNMRTFEIPGCGGAQIAQDSPDHQRFLTGCATVLFEDYASLASALDGEPPDLRGLLSCLKGQTYADRVQSLLRVFKL